MTLGQKLRAAREAAGYSVSEAAQKLGISQPYLSNLEKDRKTNPSMDILYTIAGLYKVPFSELVSQTSEENQQNLHNFDVINDREREIEKIVDLLRKIDDTEFDKAFKIVKNILQEFID